MKTLEDLKKEVIQLTEAINNCIKHETKKERSKLWTPPVHKDGYYISAAGSVYKTAHGNALKEKDAGRTFETRETAEKAAKFFKFYQRLYQLALECNKIHSAHSVYNRHYIYFNTETNKFGWYSTIDNNRTDGFFTSHEAAKAACDIMNRDKWVLPTL